MDRSIGLTFTVGSAMIDHNGFCRIDLDSSRNDTLDTVSAEELVDTVFEVCDGTPHLILTDARGVAGIVSPGAREFIRNSEKMRAVRKAEAFIVDSLANKLIANFYIRFNKPPNPTRVFNNELDAVEWLRTHDGTY